MLRTLRTSEAKLVFIIEQIAKLNSRVRSAETEFGDGGVALCKAAEKNMIEIILNDRLGKKVRVKCNEDDTIGDLKKLAAAHLGTRPEKLRLQKWNTVFKDHITLDLYELSDGSSIELYYN